MNGDKKRRRGEKVGFFKRFGEGYTEGYDSKMADLRLRDEMKRVEKERRGVGETEGYRAFWSQMPVKEGNWSRLAKVILGVLVLMVWAWIVWITWGDRAEAYQVGMGMDQEFGEWWGHDTSILHDAIDD